MTAQKIQTPIQCLCIVDKYYDHKIHLIVNFWSIGMATNYTIGSMNISCEHPLK